jgi:hypothetical protein
MKKAIQRAAAVAAVEKGVRRSPSRLTVDVTEDQHYKLKMFCLDNRVTLKELVGAWIDSLELKPR